MNRSINKEKGKIKTKKLTVEAPTMKTSKSVMEVIGSIWIKLDQIGSNRIKIKKLTVEAFTMKTSNSVMEVIVIKLDQIGSKLRNLQ
jgi:hypothetical protein